MSHEKTIQKDSDRINKIIESANIFVGDNRIVSHRDRFFYKYKKTFHKKKKAYEFSDANGRLPIFSVDCNDKTASKVYVVTGYSRWWSDYIKAKPDQRFAYEVVIPDLPCHLYVDLEVRHYYCIRSLLCFKI